MKIFLAEDSPSFIKRLKSDIEQLEGMKIIGEANNESDAVNGILELKPDVVILDLALAEGNGIGVLNKIQGVIQEIRVVVLSNHCANPYREKCKQLGATHFLSKDKEFNLLSGLLVLLTP